MFNGITVNKNWIGEVSYMSDEELPTGTKNGCFTIIAGFDAYQSEVATREIEKLKETKQRFLRGEKISSNNFTSAETYDAWMEKYRARKLYKVQCKCGNITFMSRETLYRKKHRVCGADCKLIEIRAKARADTYPREKHPNFDIDYTGTVFESLEILECIDDSFEGEPVVYDKRKKGKDGGKVTVYKKYRCRCYLCGKEYEFTCGDFWIRSDEYGCRAQDGYYSNTFCDCHIISSFQWRTVSILREHGVQYRVEVSFPELYGIGHKNLLRFDFAIYDMDGNIKYLLECQGKQHYKPVVEFGGTYQFNVQVQNDEVKREYAKNHNIPLIEIPYTCNTYEKEETFLQKKGII